MTRMFGALASAALLAVGVASISPALAQRGSASQAIQNAVDRTCVVDITSASLNIATGRIELQNVCYNPRAVRIS